MLVGFRGPFFEFVQLFRRNRAGLERNQRLSRGCIGFGDGIRLRLILNFYMCFLHGTASLTLAGEKYAIKGRGATPNGIEVLTRLTPSIRGSLLRRLVVPRSFTPNDPMQLSLEDFVNH